MLQEKQYVDYRNQYFVCRCRQREKRKKKKKKRGSKGKTLKKVADEQGEVSRRTTVLICCILAHQ